MKLFYSNSENLYSKLYCYLAVFSEDRRPIVALFRNEDGSIKVKETLNLPCYSNFPESEKQMWLEYAQSKSGNPSKIIEV